MYKELQQFICEIIEEQQGCDYDTVANKYYLYAKYYSKMDLETTELKRWMIDYLVNNNIIKTIKRNDFDTYYYNLSEDEINLLLIES